MPLTAPLEISQTVADSVVKPNIKGGDYKAIDTQDGFFIIRDIETMGDVPKGARGNDEAVDDKFLGSIAKYHQSAYETGKIAFPLHIGHHDDQGLKKLEFAGLFKPTRVEEKEVNGKKRPVLFSDWKVKADVFKRIQGGELLYRSPEIRNWANKKISSLAILDTEPPHFEFPMTTIGEVKVDPTAKFESQMSTDWKLEKFEEKEVVIFAEGKSGGKDPDPDEPPGGKCCGHCAQYASMLRKMTGMLGVTFEGGHMGEPMKNNAAPVNQPPASATEPVPKPAARFEDDPSAVAKFAAFEDKIAKLEKAQTERDNAEKAREMAAKALEDLKGYQLGDKAKAGLFKFAAEGEARLKEFVETLKEVTPKLPAGTFREAEIANINANDPILAKFSQQGPEKLEQAARAFSEYKTLKEKVKGYQLTAEQHIERALKANVVKEN